MVPRPLRPSTPEECASSTIMMAPWFCGRLRQSGQRADIAIHGKNAVADQQFAAGHRIELGQHALGRGHVFMRKDVDLGAGEAAAVDDAGVVQLVGNDVIFGRENGGNGAGVGGETGLKYHRRLPRS